MKQHWWRVPLYPTYIGLVSVVDYLLHNIQQTEISHAYLTFSVVGVSIYLLTILLSKIFSKQKAALLVAFWALLFFSFGHLTNYLDSLGIGRGNVTSMTLIVIWTGLVALSWTVVIIRSKNQQVQFVPAATFGLSVVLILLIIRIGNYQIHQPRLSSLITDDNDLSLADTAQAANRDKPDIYYLLFEDYAGQDVLAQEGYDNQPFLSGLKQKGFIVPAQAYSNYPISIQSLASSLNMTYLDSIAKQLGPNTGDQSVLRQMLDRPEAAKYLQDIGYSYYHLGSDWEPERYSSIADYNLLPDPKSSASSQFTNSFLNQTTAFQLIERFLPATQGPTQLERLNYQFTTLPSLVGNSGPKFVFAHFLLPHEPFLFDQNCNLLPSSQIDKYGTDIKKYTDQINCTNTHINQIVDAIIAHSKTPPIILVQSDEGMRAEITEALNGNWQSLGQNVWQQKLQILSAYYLPGFSGKLPADITPVNSFRIIFNNYFGANLPILPNRSYLYQNDNHFYKFTDVTDTVRSLK